MYQEGGLGCCFEKIIKEVLRGSKDSNGKKFRVYFYFLDS
jgi:hypothetical protein